MSGSAIEEKESRSAGLRSLPAHRFSIRLNERWALTHDHLQWMLCRRRNLKGGDKWIPASFVASNSAVLRRVIREKGIAVSEDARAALNALDGLTFREWLARYRQRSST